MYGSISVEPDEEYHHDLDSYSGFIPGLDPGAVLPFPAVDFIYRLAFNPISVSVVVPICKKPRQMLV
ncbi:hypothetical protein EVAR_2957_1 [Eumeta japonica]|uniref:Uncharacterized protein n=1 Tax=Eumeta variegata TaxID=151549 RepID=A0A4C1T1W5_EUMVA|nr:hypothetical protein EVAR_2957_1 [Eumeta japonica]